MSDQLEISMTPANARACRVSYIINNRQPVRSTIIGDQPLFYMDFDSAAETEADDAFFDFSEFSVLESEIETLKREIRSYEDRFSQNAEDKVATARLFEEDRHFIERIKAPDASASSLIKTLSLSRMAKAYLDFAAAHKVEIILSAQVSDAAYERKGGFILINPALDFADMVLLAARELRRHWQHRKGALIHPLLFHPDKAIIVNRAQEADLCVAMIRVAWELQLAGEKQAWRRVETSSLSDLAHALAREAFLDFRTLNNGQASAAVFETWFLSERCRSEDRRLIKQMLADYRGYVFGADHGPADVTPALIAALGEMPYGKNYLMPHAKTILSDAVFTEVRDRSNANFLWFIKFERSFRETERELQSPVHSHAPGDRPDGANRQEKDHEKDAPPRASGEIVSIYPQEDGEENRARGRFARPKDGAGRKGKDGRANVVRFRRRD